jgi:hypothetical protein
VKTIILLVYVRYFGSLDRLKIPSRHSGSNKLNVTVLLARLQASCTISKPIVCDHSNHRTINYTNRTSLATSQLNHGVTYVVGLRIRTKNVSPGTSFVSVQPEVAPLGCQFPLIPLQSVRNLVSPIGTQCSVAGATPIRISPKYPRFIQFSGYQLNSLTSHRFSSRTRYGAGALIA